MISSGKFQLRKMNKGDFAIMAKWLSDADVFRYYGGQALYLNDIEKKYGPRVEGRHYVTPCILEAEEGPAAFIQYYPIQPDYLEKYGYAHSAKIFGIDQFVGGSRLFGQGIGTAMILLMLCYLKEQKRAEKVVLEVDAANTRAISCYLKCGFAKIQRLDDGQDLMEWNP